jgi:DNA-binding NarL/FixJ family response regulator
MRLLIVDDHPIVREGLAAVLEDQPDFAVVGSAGSAADAIRLTEAHQPDVLLLDLELGTESGIETIPRLLEACPSMKILVFTAYDTDERVFGALKAGVKGYLLKGASAGEIARAIRTVHGGGSYLEPRVAEKVVAEATAPRRAGDRLSQREREVLRLAADGLANKQIARALGITERTVKFHIASIFAKLGAENRAQAVSLALRKGWLQPEGDRMNPF